MAKNINKSILTCNKIIHSDYKKNMIHHSPNQFAGNRILRAIKRRSLSKLNSVKNLKHIKEDSNYHPILIESDESTGNDSDCVCLGSQPSTSNASKIISNQTSKSKQNLNRNYNRKKIGQLKSNTKSNTSHLKVIGRVSVPSSGCFTSTPINPSKMCLNAKKKTKRPGSNVAATKKADDQLNKLEPCDNQLVHIDLLDFDGDNKNRIPILPESKFSLLKEEFVDDDILIVVDIGEEEKTIPAVVEENFDSSVIIINDSDTSLQSDFIPLVSKDPLHEPLEIKNGKQQKPLKDDLFTSMDKRQLDKYNDNTYNPSAGLVKLKKKRTIIVDGSNVAFNHGLSQEFSVKGIKICIDYFESKGHEVKAVLPLFRQHKCTDPSEMEKLHKSGKIVFTPCKNVSGKTTSSYDDRFILQLACELDAAIVSNDNYRDLMSENSAFEKIIKNRVIGYSWCNDIFLLPKDPYGRNGPTLYSILNRT